MAVILRYFLSYNRIPLIFFTMFGFFFNLFYNTNILAIDENLANLKSMNMMTKHGNISKTWFDNAMTLMNCTLGLALSVFHAMAMSSVLFNAKYRIMPVLVHLLRIRNLICPIITVLLEFAVFHRSGGYSKGKSFQTSHVQAIPTMIFGLSAVLLYASYEKYLAEVRTIYDYLTLNLRCTRGLSPLEEETYMCEAMNMHSCREALRIEQKRKLEGDMKAMLHIEKERERREREEREKQEAVMEAKIKMYQSGTRSFWKQIVMYLKTVFGFQSMKADEDNIPPNIRVGLERHREAMKQTAEKNACCAVPPVNVASRNLDYNCDMKPITQSNDPRPVAKNQCAGGGNQKPMPIQTANQAVVNQATPAKKSTVSSSASKKTKETTQSSMPTTVEQERKENKRREILQKIKDLATIDKSDTDFDEDDEINNIFNELPRADPIVSCDLIKHSPPDCIPICTTGVPPINPFAGGATGANPCGGNACVTTTCATSSCGGGGGRSIQMNGRRPTLTRNSSQKSPSANCSGTYCSANACSDNSKGTCVRAIPVKVTCTESRKRSSSLGSSSTTSTSAISKSSNRSRSVNKSPACSRCPGSASANVTRPSTSSPPCCSKTNTVYTGGAEDTVRTSTDSPSCCPKTEAKCGSKSGCKSPGNTFKLDMNRSVTRKNKTCDTSCQRASPQKMSCTSCTASPPPKQQASCGTGGCNRPPPVKQNSSCQSCVVSTANKPNKSSPKCCESRSKSSSNCESGSCSRPRSSVPVEQTRGGQEVLRRCASRCGQCFTRNSRSPLGCSIGPKSNVASTGTETDGSDSTIYAEGNTTTSPNRGMSSSRPKSMACCTIPTPSTNKYGKNKLTETKREVVKSVTNINEEDKKICKETDKLIEEILQSSSNPGETKTMREVTVSRNTIQQPNRTIREETHNTREEIVNFECSQDVCHGGFGKIASEYQTRQDRMSLLRDDAGDAGNDAVAYSDTRSLSSSDNSSRPSRSMATCARRSGSANASCANKTMTKRNSLSSSPYRGVDSKVDHQLSLLDELKAEIVRRWPERRSELYSKHDSYEPLASVEYPESEYKPESVASSTIADPDEIQCQFEKNASKIRQLQDRVSVTSDADQLELMVQQIDLLEQQQLNFQLQAQAAYEAKKKMESESYYERKKLACTSNAEFGALIKEVKTAIKHRREPTELLDTLEKIDSTNRELEEQIRNKPDVQRYLSKNRGRGYSNHFLFASVIKELKRKLKQRESGCDVSSLTSESEIIPEKDDSPELIQQRLEKIDEQIEARKEQLGLVSESALAPITPITYESEKRSSSPVTVNIITTPSSIISGSANDDSASHSSYDSGSHPMSDAYTEGSDVENLPTHNYSRVVTSAEPLNQSIRLPNGNSVSMPVSRINGKKLAHDLNLIREMVSRGKPDGRTLQSITVNARPKTPSSQRLRPPTQSHTPRISSGAHSGLRTPTAPGVSSSNAGAAINTRMTGAHFPTHRQTLTCRSGAVKKPTSTTPTVQRSQVSRIATNLAGSKNLAGSNPCSSQCSPRLVVNSVTGKTHTLLGSSPHRSGHYKNVQTLTPDYGMLAKHYRRTSPSREVKSRICVPCGSSAQHSSTKSQKV